MTPVNSFIPVHMSDNTNFSNMFQENNLSEVLKYGELVLGRWRWKPSQIFALQQYIRYHKAGTAEEDCLQGSGYLAILSTCYLSPSDVYPLTDVVTRLSESLRIQLAKPACQMMIALGQRRDA